MINLDRKKTKIGSIGCFLSGVVSGILLFVTSELIYIPVTILSFSHAIAFRGIYDRMMKQTAKSEKTTILEAVETRKAIDGVAKGIKKNKMIRTISA